jgi:hypothetical protein
MSSNFSQIIPADVPYHVSITRKTLKVTLKTHPPSWFVRKNKKERIDNNIKYSFIGFDRQQ